MLKKYILKFFFCFQMKKTFLAILLNQRNWVHHKKYNSPKTYGASTNQQYIKKDISPTEPNY